MIQAQAGDIWEYWDGRIWLLLEYREGYWKCINLELGDKENLFMVFSDKKKWKKLA